MQRSVPLVARLVGLFALLLCGGCDVQFPQQEVRFRYDAETDTLDVLMIYRGVHTPNDTDKALAKGVDVVDRILAGRREFMFIDWPFYFDWDDKEDDADAHPRALDVESRLELVRAGAFLDEEQRLCGYQLFKWRELNKSLV